MLRHRGEPDAGLRLHGRLGLPLRLAEVFIEWSKVDQCKSNWIGHLTWMCV